MQYAGFWWRFLAAIIDNIILTIALLVVAIPLGISLIPTVASDFQETTSLAMPASGNLINIIVYWLYFTILESSNWQATVGKRLLGMKVTTLEGAAIGFGQANVRYWSKIISAVILFIGYVMIGFTEKKQGLHDIIAKTLVLKTE